MNQNTTKTTLAAEHQRALNDFLRDPVGKMTEARDANPADPNSVVAPGTSSASALIAAAERDERKRA